MSELAPMIESKELGSELRKLTEKWKKGMENNPLTVLVNIPVDSITVVFKVVVGVANKMLKKLFSKG